jgi:dephospho-CoA kinase
MILGVTGGIATGKSSVTRLFRAMGFPVVNADELAREVVAPGTGTLNEIVAQFGSAVLLDDGSLDRERLSQLIFSDDAARSRLNKITHPAIAKLAETRLAELVANGAKFVVYEAPLLYEAGAENRVDKVLVVTADADVQKKRLMKRDGIDAQTAELRINAQMPLADKVSRADFVVDNSESLSETSRQVKALCHELAIRLRD